MGSLMRGDLAGEEAAATRMMTGMVEPMARAALVPQLSGFVKNLLGRGPLSNPAASGIANRAAENAGGVPLVPPSIASE